MLRKQDFYETEIWPRWLAEFRQSPFREYPGSGRTKHM